MGLIPLDLSISDEKIDFAWSIALLVLSTIDRVGALDRQRSISLHRSISIDWTTISLNLSWSLKLSLISVGFLVSTGIPLICCAFDCYLRSLSWSGNPMDYISIWLCLNPCLLYPWKSNACQLYPWQSNAYDLLCLSPGRLCLKMIKLRIHVWKSLQSISPCLLCLISLELEIHVCLDPSDMINDFSLMCLIPCLLLFYWIVIST